MADEEENRDSSVVARLWGRLMPKQLWSGLTLLASAGFAAIGLAGSFVTLAGKFGMEPVLRFAGVSVAILLVLLSILLHVLSLRALLAGIRREDELRQQHRVDLEALREHVTQAIQEFTGKLMEDVKSRGAETREAMKTAHEHTARAVKVAEVALDAAKKRQDLLDEVSHRVDRISEKLGIK